MRRLTILFATLCGLMLSGCLGTVADVVTAPVKVVSKGVDLATTSQSESDEKRGRVMSFFTVAFLGMHPLGSLAAGAIAAEPPVSPTAMERGYDALDQARSSIERAAVAS